MITNRIVCPHCKNTETVRRGYINTTAKGKQQRYYCKQCNKKFIARNGFYRMRNTPHKITLCLDLFYRGVSTRKIQEHLQAFYPHNSSHVSIYNWLLKYSKMISDFTDRLSLNVGADMQVDEVEFKVLGKPCWFIDSIDTETRFLVSANLAKSRSSEEIKNVLKFARDRTGKQICTITTDSFNGYQNTVRKAFGYDSQLRTWNVIHNKINASKGEGFNYPIERLHNSIRQRTKTFRGFHGSVESARTIMKGYEIFYNFIRIHQGIGVQPYQLAIPNLKLNSENKWLELIKLANRARF